MSKDQGTPSTAQTTLSADTTPSELQLTVSSAASAGIVARKYIRVDDEIMFVEAVHGNTVTVARGQKGSVAAVHSALVSVTTRNLAASGFTTVTTSTVVDVLVDGVAQ
eukprot:494757-Rhodomonas_salina.2